VKIARLLTLFTLALAMLTIAFAATPASAQGNGWHHPMYHQVWSHPVAYHRYWRHHHWYRRERHNGHYIWIRL
jgi:Spy/CpxP family protein refolding chaperone